MNLQIKYTKSDSAFTVVELLVAIAVMGLLAYLAMPYISDFYGSFNRRNAEVQLIEDLRLAQATAVEQGCQGIFAIDADSKGYTFGCDYVPYSTAIPPVADSVRFSKSFPNLITMQSDGAIIFNTKGQSIDENGYVITRNITLQESSTTFINGVLRPTGFFAYQ